MSGEAFCERDDAIQRADYQIHRVLQAQCVDQSAGREHVPSRYFIYGHEEVLENRFQSN